MKGEGKRSVGRNVPITLDDGSTLSMLYQGKEGG